ncbi:MAG: WbqC family protein [Flavobacteriales bacterium]|nr:WbqC family protein [Flavobacteriales bacterium]MBK9289669.1 WbqC family protein [Flavobacteriales bacterium]
MVPVLPAFYFGSVEHYRLLAKHPRVIIDLGEHYERQSYRTRTRIVGPNGVQDLTVQIARRSGEKMPMHTVGLSYAETWPQQHVHAIRSAYGNTPWFIHYIDEIEAVVLKKYERLVDLDLATMRLGLKWLGLGTEVLLSEEYVVPSLLSDVLSRSMSSNGRGHETSDNEQGIDLRTTLHPKRPLPPELTAVPAYPQIFADRHGFAPRMSVIDLVMNAGPEARRSLLA